ncbi:DNA polymerase III subunit beta [Infirmifilum uzonense]|uniref:DNA polymerase III subunit beta n=1 Tax=Infirmifilum uzonense TaxID=1550241 RepID=A0A0F7FI32_9CREN|nr:nucleotidyltransferase domain-containing protein [Infirmifilum uzonense]AKG38578.1 DNA polymerase III subunit beta [Infirmifilum uzonense]
MKSEDAEELENIVERLRAKYKLHAVILFGSRARGDWGPWSDYDFLLIAEFDQPYLRRMAEVLEAVADTELPVELHPYTPDEALSMLEKGNPLIVDALEEGIVLYSSPTLHKLKDKLEELKQRGLSRTNTTIRFPP